MARRPVLAADEAALDSPQDWMQPLSLRQAEPVVAREHLPRADLVEELVDGVPLARLLRHLLR